MTTAEKKYNELVSHPLQSFEWGEFRKKTGVTIIRTDTFQLSIHTIPHTPFTIGYLPKGDMPNKETIEELRKIGKDNKCIFIQIEPNAVTAPPTLDAMRKIGLAPAAHPLFTKFTFILDLAQSEEDLLKNMHQKTRYNIRVAEKHGVSIVEDNSDEAFEEYLKLTQETTKRQGFFAHTEKYHRLMWETLRPNQDKPSDNSLTAHLFLAKYKNEALAAWIVFVFKDTLYYPYGSSSSKFRETMASNLMMWEIIKFGKKLGLKKFDMWGALSSEPSKNDPWYGFHRFKEGYGPRLVEFVGSYDLVLSRPLYEMYKLADKIRWTLLKLSRR